MADSDPTIILDPDAAIIANLTVSAIVALAIFLGFCLARMKLTSVYSPNVAHAKNTGLLELENGMFSWIIPSLSMPNQIFLSLVGLDSFQFIQTLKLLFVILVYVAVPTLFTLLPIYYFTGTGTGFVLTDLSILSQPRNIWLWIPLVLCYYTAFVIIYITYSFYRSNTALRQVYLVQPSCITSVLTMSRSVHFFGSLAAAQRTRDLPTRTVVLTGISSKFDKDGLKEFLNGLRMGEIQSIVMVRDRSQIKEILEKRNRTLRKFEMTLKDFYDNIVHESSKGQESSPLLEQAGILSDLSTPDRCRFLRQVIDLDFMTDLRPRGKRRTGMTDLIEHYYSKLIYLDDQLDVLIKEFADSGSTVDEPDTSSKGEEESQPSNASSSSGFSRTAHQETGLISIKKVGWLGHNFKDFKLTLWGTSQIAIIVFQRPQAASICSQTLLSSKPFSMVAEKAPAADNILWQKLYLPGADRWLRMLIGEMIYLLTIIFFGTVVSTLSALTKLDAIEKEFPSLTDWLDERPSLRPIVGGVLAPLVYNIAFLLVPYILLFVAMYQGKISKTAVQYEVAYKYAWFLFIQSFVVLLAGTLIDVFSFVAHGKYGFIIEKIQTSMPVQAAFFINVIIQKALIGLFVVLLKPGDLIMWIVKHATNIRQSPRDQEEARAPKEVQYGVLYPEYVTFVFQITLSFMIISPVILIAGIVFYVIAYFIFRHHFIYSFITPFESGGIYWERILSHIIIGLIVSQILTTLQFSIRGAVFQALTMIPLIIATLFVLPFLRRIFKRRFDYPPLSSQEEAATDALVTSLRGRQHDALESTGAARSRKPSCVERGYMLVPVRFADVTERTVTDSSSECIVRESWLDNPYSNPVLFLRVEKLMLPPLFLPMIKALVVSSRKCSTSEQKGG